MARRFTSGKFGDGVAFFLHDKNLIEVFQQQLINFSNLNSKFDKFPGALPVALTRKNIHLLQTTSSPHGAVVADKNDGNHEIFQLPNGKKRRVTSVTGATSARRSTYYVTRKSDGIRYQLMFHYRDREKYIDLHQTLFNRKMEPIMVKFEVPDFLHQGTVLDGELVKEGDGTHAYYIFDIIALNGYTVTIRNLADRLQLIELLLPFIRPCSDTKESPFLLKTKRFAPVQNLLKFLKEENLEYLMNSSTSSKEENKDDPERIHPCDGLCFIERDEGVVAGTATRQLKWKKIEYCTIDVLIRLTSTTCEMFIKDDFGIQLFAIQKLEDTLPPAAAGAGAGAMEYNNKIVECWYCQKSNIWKVKNIRKDKHIPNYFKTVEDTMQSIKDNITIADIVNLKEPTVP
jgi:hypothetical protein